MASRVAVIGAGPHGLSIAAHLSGRGLQPLAFGRTMHSWRNMPEGMTLSSEGLDCGLSAPNGEFTLAAFCAAQRRPYADFGSAVAVEDFAAYGEAFQQRYAPQADARSVTRLARGRQGFDLTLEDGARVEAAKVVVATGLAAFASVPAPLARMSGERMTHSSALRDAAAFARQRVLVIGAGASATGCAAALAVAGADVTLVCREPHLRWTLQSERRRGIAARFPQLFPHLPEWMRSALAGGGPRPAPNPFVREIIEGKVRVLAAREILGARESEAGLEVELGRIGSQIEYFLADHVVLGTGYRVDLNRLGLLAPELKTEIARVAGSPRLNAAFESSVPGLYFAGAMAAYSFGPAMHGFRGADFAARRITAAIADGVESPAAVPDRSRPRANARVDEATRRA